MSRDSRHILDIYIRGWIVTYIPSAPDDSERGMNAGWYVQRDNFESWIELEVGGNHMTDHKVIGNRWDNPELSKEAA